METKDTLFAIGLLITLVIGLLNFYLTVKNRSNNLREHVYKEQIRICSLLMEEYTNFNFHLTALNESPNIENESVKFFERIGELVYKNEHILPNSIVTLANETLYKCQPFFEALETKNILDMKNGHDAYFENYFLLVILIRDYFGIDDLSKKNQSLYKLPKYFKSIIKKFE